MHAHAMKKRSPTPRSLMACLGDRSRFRLVQVLTEGARCVSELALEVGLSQSCTTRHLQLLERRRVVTGNRDGKRVLYRLRDDEPALRSLLAWALRSRQAAGTIVPSGPGPPALPGQTVRPGRPAGRQGAPGRVPRETVPVGGDVAAGRPRAGVRPESGPGARSGRADRAAERAEGPAGRPAPAEPEPMHEPEPPPETEAAPDPPWRRSDIEDFLL